MQVGRANTVSAQMSRIAVVTDKAHSLPTASPVVLAARAALLERFRWSAGHADVWRVFADAGALAAVVDGLAEPWRDVGITHVLGIESRGFLLGAAVAVNLGVGFQAIRKGDGMLPGPKLSAATAPDYRQREHLLRMQHVLSAADLALLVDDWAERGSQASAARHLVEMSGAQFAGVSVLVDQMNDHARARLKRVTSLVRADELENSDDG
jgi:adenine phosphoribosyltransferase